MAGEPSDAVRGVFDLSTQHIAPLAYTGEEVKTTADDIGPPEHKLLGKHATEAKLKSEPLADFEILHLAVHGFLNTGERGYQRLRYPDCLLAWVVRTMMK